MNCQLKIKLTWIGVTTDKANKKGALIIQYMQLSCNSDKHSSKWVEPLETILIANIM